MGSTGPALDVLIDGRSVETDDPRAVRQALLATAGARFAEIWISLTNGPAMALLKSDDRVLCLFVRHHGDPGFTSRRPLREKKTRLAGDLEFRLGKGERSRFPAEWTVPMFVALRAADEFLRTGAKPPQIQWHDDGSPSKKAKRTTKQPRKKRTT